MKKLDMLSRGELGTIAFLAGAIAFGTTGVVAFFVIEYYLGRRRRTSMPARLLRSAR